MTAIRLKVGSAHYYVYRPNSDDRFILYSAARVIGQADSCVLLTSTQVARHWIVYDVWVAIVNFERGGEFSEDEFHESVPQTAVWLHFYFYGRGDLSNEP